MTLSELPVEILHEIFSYLSRREIFWGIGLCCQRLLHISYESIPHFIPLPIYVSNFQQLMTFFQENVYQWNEIRDVITSVIICDSIDHAETIYRTSKYISYYNGMTICISCISFSSDFEVASFLLPFRHLMCISLDSLNLIPSNDLFIALDGQHDNLQCIQLAKASKISDEGVLYMTDNKHNLKSITLHEALLLSNISFHISSQNCNQLKELKISWCRNLSDSAIIQLSKSCIGISTLHISGSHKVTDRAIKEVFLRFEKLEDIDISGCVNVTDNCFQYLSETNIGIKKINVGGCRNITDVALNYISRACYELEYLYLGGCILVTDVGIKNLSKCKKLIGLSLAECYKIGDASVSEIAKDCTPLRALILYRCEKITDEVLTCIAEHSSNLVTLDVRYCFRITDIGLSSIARECKFLKNLYLDSAFYRKSSIKKYQWYELFDSKRISLSPLKGPFYDEI